MMYRVVAIASCALALAACSSMGDWMKPAPVMDTVQFESDPPGAEAKVSNGQTCRTPCALALTANANYTVTFTLTGFQPATESIELMPDSGHLQPNPVEVALEPAAPAKPVKKPPPKKPAAKPRQPSAAAPPPPPPPAAPPGSAAPSPWPPAQR